MNIIFSLGNSLGFIGALWKPCAFMNFFERRNNNETPGEKNIFILHKTLSFVSCGNLPRDVFLIKLFFTNKT